MLFRSQRPADRSATFLAAHLRLQFAELYRVLETLEQMGMIARTSDNRWLLSCDPAKTPLTPLFDNLLLNRSQARLQNDPDALRVLRSILMDDEPPMLEELRQTAQNSDKLEPDPTDRRPVVATTAQGDNHHAKSQ